MCSEEHNDIRSATRCSVWETTGVQEDDALLLLFEVLETPSRKTVLLKQSLTLPDDEPQISFPSIEGFPMCTPHYARLPIDFLVSCCLSQDLPV